MGPALLLVALGLAQAAPKPAGARKPAVSKPAPVKPAEHLCPGGEAGSRRVSVNGQCVSPPTEKAAPAAPRPEPAPAPNPKPVQPTVIVAAAAYPLLQRGHGDGPVATTHASRPGLRDCVGLGEQPAETRDRPAPVALFEDRSLRALVEAGALGKACQRIALDDDSPAGIAWYNLAVLRDLGGDPAAGLVALARAEEIGLPAGLGPAAAALLLEHAQASPSAE